MLVEHEKNLQTTSRRRVVYKFFECSTNNSQVVYQLITHKNLWNQIMTFIVELSID